MSKEELLRLLQDEDVASAIFNIVKNGAVREKKTPQRVDGAAAVREAIAKKREREAEEKSSLSQNMIKSIRAKVERAAAERMEAKEKQEQQEQQEQPSGVDAEDSVAEVNDIIPFSTDSDNEEIDFEKRLALLQSHVDKKAQEEEDKQKQSTLQKNQSSAPKIKTDADYRILVERVCPVCEQKTRAIKYKSKLPVVSRDLDLCVQYNGINPYLYTVISCEHCGFAAEEKKFMSKLPARHRQALMEFLVSGNMIIPFHEDRSVSEAVAITKAAALFSEMTDKSPSREANLNLTIAWIYRYAEDKEAEKEYLLKAAELYERALATERAFAGNISANTVMYLVGAIYFLTENYEQSASYISRMISDHSLRASDPRIYERAKDLWQDIRAIRDSGGGAKNG
ncbi:MAG: DUF2225 domain-containing protein [Selenomonadaceae bacterium]|nr:DUF2225 domain-containing protein [Selenomonadaceae bacterium]